MTNSSIILLLLISAVCFAGKTKALAAAEPSSGQRPNILLIITDQQHAGMLSAAGNKYLQTPAMDSLARTGTRFEQAYCANPVCEPSRFSMMTGLMPSTIGLRFNQDVPSNKDVPDHV